MTAAFDRTQSMLSPQRSIGVDEVVDRDQDMVDLHVRLRS
jgi:hypothetical protein